MSSIRKRAWDRPDGTVRSAWQVDYRDQSGKRRSKQFSRKKDAETWSVTALAEVQTGVHTADSQSITVARAADMYLDSIRALDREITTIAAYEQHIRIHILPKCGAVKLSQLTAPGVKRYLDDWLRSLSRAMATRIWRTFKAIINEAQVSGYVAQNVALSVRPSRAKRENGKVLPPPKDDLRALLAAAETSNDIMGRAIVELAIFTGMRASELRGLAWHSVDLSKQQLHIRQRADAKGCIGLPKTEAGQRTIPLPKRVVMLLTEWKIACPPQSEQLVFPSVTGKALSHPVMMKKHVGAIQLTAGLVQSKDHAKPRYSLHPFRHATASMWIEQGLNPKRVQYLMGHSSIQVTFDTYGHLFEHTGRDAADADAIERALFAPM
ncbi:tyrosine-type recombinase/integrase [Parasphingorhabdus flavimaris]|uniref:tyrosine-type recombinase/integrase n=1 Tax=Parasphingorhabdus flavimaris TaxID=266812 RepID=UPI00300294E2